MTELQSENNNRLRQSLVFLQDHIVLKEDETPKKLEGQQEKFLPLFSEKISSEEEFLVLPLKKLRLRLAFRII